MKRLDVRLLVVGMSSFVGCADGGEPTGSRFQIEVAPLTLPNSVNACYTLEVRNDLEQTVWSKTQVCADQYGARSAITYIGTCDATEQDTSDTGVALNTVTVTVENIYTADPTDPVNNPPIAVPDSEWDNPCSYLANGSQVSPNGDSHGPCTLAIECEENADVEVLFNLTVMRDANQGFFDIAVNFEDIFCSSKVDCTTPGDGDEEIPLQLLFHPETGERHDTIVIGRACTAGPGKETQIHTTPTYITCGIAPPVFGPNMPETRHIGLVFGWNPSSGDGNQGQSNLISGWDPWFFNGMAPWALGLLPGDDWIGYPSLASIVDQIAWENANYSGMEQLPGLGKVYQNEAIGFDFELLEKWWTHVAICQNPDPDGTCPCFDTDEDGFCDCEVTVTASDFGTMCCDGPSYDVNGEITNCASAYFQGIDSLPAADQIDWDFAGCSLLTAFTATDSDGFPPSDEGSFSNYPYGSSATLVATDGSGDPLLGGNAIAFDTLDLAGGKGQLLCTRHPLDTTGTSNYDTMYDSVDNVQSLLTFCMEGDTINTPLQLCVEP